MISIGTTIRRVMAATALVVVAAAIVVPSSMANGDDGDRATSKPRFVAPQGWGDMGDRATSKPLYAPISTPATVVRVVSPSGFEWTDFAIGAAAMFGAIALLGAARFGLKGGRAGHALRNT